MKQTLIKRTQSTKRLKMKFSSYGGDSTLMAAFSLLPPEEALGALAKSTRSHVRGQLFESIFPQPPGLSDLLLCFKKMGED